MIISSVIGSDLISSESTSNPSKFFLNLTKSKFRSNWGFELYNIEISTKYPPTKNKHYAIINPKRPAIIFDKLNYVSTILELNVVLIECFKLISF